MIQCAAIKVGEVEIAFHRKNVTDPKFAAILHGQHVEIQAVFSAVYCFGFDFNASAGV